MFYLLIQKITLNYLNMVTLGILSHLTRLYDLILAEKICHESGSKLPTKLMKSDLTPGSCIFCDNTNNLRSMHKNYNHNDNEENYTQMLSLCYNIQVVSVDDEKNESDICEGCINRLKDAYAFRNQIESVDETLEELYAGGNLSQLEDEPINPTKLKTRRVKLKRKKKSKTNQSSDNEDFDYDSIFKMNRLSSFQSSVKVQRKFDDDCFQSDDDVFSKWNEQKKTSNKNKPPKEEAKNKRAEVMPPLDPSITKCPVCDRNFILHYLLEKHYVTHFKKFLCDICGMACVHKSSLLNHMALHSDTTFSCNICCKNYPTKNSLVSHIKKLHSKISGEYRCPFCQVRFSDYSMRVNHLSKVHGVEARTFKCDPCDRKFSRASRLTEHVRRFHQRIKNHKCTQCRRQFFTGQELRMHLITHTGVKNFHCNMCNKSYARKSILVEHMKIHANTRAHKCKHCDKAFVQKSTLKAHLRTHPNTKEEPPPC